jgi:hypothetical protein
MIVLNIISPELKNEIKLKSIYQTIKKFFVLIGFFAVVFTVILASSDFFLKSYLKEISQKNNIVNKETNETIQAVDDINKKINEVALIQKEEVTWLNFLKLIADNTPKDVKYNKISMNKNDGLILSGQSKTREGLIEVKKFLDSSPFLGDINFPISNLLEKENINFNITAKIKNYEF